MDRDVVQAEPQKGTSAPPTPKGRFLVGHAWEFRKDVLGYLRQCAQQHGDIVALRLFHIRCCLVNSPELIREVLVQQKAKFIKPFDLRMLSKLIGNGLLTSDGDFWMRQRRLAQPAFHPQRIRSYGKIAAACAQEMLARWEDGATLDIHREMMAVTQKIAAETLFSAEVSKEGQKVGEALEMLMNRFAAILTSAVPFPLSLLSPANFKVIRAMRTIDRVVYSIIRQRRESGRDAGDLLSILLHAQDEDGSRMTNKQLRDEILILFTAGHETTALAMSYTLYLLAQHPRVEERILHELELCRGRTPTAEDYDKLEYTQWVIKESLRLYPPAWGIGRDAIEEVELGGYRIEPGTMVLMLPYLLHRDARYFDNPLEFKPERWQDHLAKQIPKYAYFPFGGGPRLCIGAGMAMMEATILLAAVVQKFSVKLVDDAPLQLVPSITLRPRDSIRLTLQSHRKKKARY